MTQKQINKALTFFNHDVPIKDWPLSDRTYYAELSCREMINSILIYGEDITEGSPNWKEYIRPYYEKVNWREPLLTKERALQLIREQQYDISQAKIGFSGMDSEGVSYNYCRFVDEK